jgi:UDP-glucose 6-dehydrogenase
MIQLNPIASLSRLLASALVFGAITGCGGSSSGPSAASDSASGIGTVSATTDGAAAGTTTGSAVGTTGGTVTSDGTVTGTASAASGGSVANTVSTPVVTGVNSAPLIAGTPSTSVLVGRPYTFAPNTGVSGTEQLTFVIANKPAWAAFDTSTGELSGTPNEADVGTYPNITVGVSAGTASAQLKAFAITVKQVGDGSVTLSWLAPTENTDGSALTDLVGYHIYYGTSASDLGYSIDVDDVGIQTYVINNLDAGTWFFAVTAYNDEQVESNYSSIPKDVKALIRSAKHAGHDAELLRSVESVNERQKTVLISKLRTQFHGQLAGRTFALWGLAFKPNTDDMREAPSRVIIDALLAAGATVRAYDPVASAEASRIYATHSKAAKLVFCKDAYEAVQGADALLIATEWKEFRSPDFDRLKTLLARPLIFDGRNLYDPVLMERLGLQYFAIGRGRVGQAADSAVDLDTNRVALG